ncbi:DUF2946 family protein [Duganella radicis]|nr:DUF2946 family protein [Duganella radicis]
MPTLFQHRRLTSLIVFVTILLNLCAPAIGKAVTVLAADPLVLDICSASPAPAPAKQPGHAIKHCVFCAPYSGSEAPPPAPAGLLSVLEGHDDYPLPRHDVPAAASPRTTAQPRGPPAA